MISSFISSCSFSTLFIKTNWLWIIFESIKALEIKPSILFNLALPNITILSYFFFYFLIIPAVIAQIFNPIAKLVIPKAIPSKEAKAWIKTQPVTAEAKIRKCSKSFMSCTDLSVLITH